MLVLEALFAAARCGHLALARYTSSYGHTIIYDVWPPVPAFPRPNCRPNAVCLPVSSNNHDGSYEAISLFVNQTGD